MKWDLLLYFSPTNHTVQCLFLDMFILSKMSCIPTEMVPEVGYYVACIPKEMVSEVGYLMSCMPKEMVSVVG